MTTNQQRSKRMHEKKTRSATINESDHYIYSFEIELTELPNVFLVFTFIKHARCGKVLSFLSFRVSSDRPIRCMSQNSNLEVLGDYVNSITHAFLERTKIILSEQRLDAVSDSTSLAFPVSCALNQKLVRIGFQGAALANVLANWMWYT